MSWFKSNRTFRTNLKVEEVPMKIIQDQVPLKIYSKSGAFENIIMDIPY